MDYQLTYLKTVLTYYNMKRIYTQSEPTALSTGIAINFSFKDSKSLVQVTSPLINGEEQTKALMEDVSGQILIREKELDKFYSFLTDK